MKTHPYETNTRHLYVRNTLYVRFTRFFGLFLHVFGTAFFEKAVSVLYFLHNCFIAATNIGIKRAGATSYRSGFDVSTI